ncbi:MAG: methionine--tRNA ligase [archaeon]
MNNKLITNIPNKFYITTPIYYANGRFHLGHAYTTIAADVFTRYYRLLGTDVFFLTGTDEHGLKVSQTAQDEGVPVQQYIDNLINDVKKSWKELDISYNNFIRTTDNAHIEFVKSIAKKMFDNGDIYFGEYEGYYCKGCESFYTEKDLVNTKCPEGHPVTLEKEKAYFFKLTKYQDWLLDYIEKNSKFLQPESNRNEIIAFLKRGLQDLCISREKVSWGIPFPPDEKYTIYVWLDALFNYVSGLGGFESNNFKKYWQPDLQLMGKEIFRFHAIYWPIFLHSLDYPLPKIIFAHGWWTSEGQKMSKSFNNMIYAEDYTSKYGVDTFRYYLLREVSFGSDGSFSKKTFVDRINHDLVSEIGNLYSRVLTLAQKKNQDTGYKYYKDELGSKIEERIKSIHEKYQAIDLTRALFDVFEIASFANKYVQENKPWELITTNPEKFDQVMYSLLETLRILALELSPFLTSKWKVAFEQLGLDINNQDHKILEYTNIMENKIVKRGEYLFEKVDEEKKI